MWFGSIDNLETILTRNLKMREIKHWMVPILDGLLRTTKKERWLGQEAQESRLDCLQGMLQPCYREVRCDLNSVHTANSDRG